MYIVVHKNDARSSFTITLANADQPVGNLPPRLKSIAALTPYDVKC